MKRKQDCCGCTACMNICPRHCIKMREDAEGFLYPEVDTDACTHCNACNKVCPLLSADNNDKADQLRFSDEMEAYAATVVDKETLLNSSSGGLFTAFATAILHKGGVVYGAAWVNGMVQHMSVGTIDALQLLRGSKYVQSSLEGTFVEVRKHLKNHRGVLFCGTPCQIAGLHTFLRNNVAGLLTIEVACHGVPSPKALEKYIQLLRQQYGNDVQLCFRAKPEGWKRYKVTAFTGNTHHFFESQTENIFMRGFLRELYSRPICHQCPFKIGKSKADITLGDFWGIEQVLPDFQSYMGASVVLTHTRKGKDAFIRLQNIEYEKVDLRQVIWQNRSLIHSTSPHPERSYFFQHIDKQSFDVLVENCLRMRLVTQLRLRVKSYFEKIRKLI